MRYLETESDYIVRLERGEEILGALEKFCLEKDIAAASVSGIGACDLAEVGVYEIDKKAYMKNTYTGSMEILSLLGNITRKDGRPYLHLHITLCGEDNRCIGGHLNKARISVTGEIFIHPVNGLIGRVPDDVTGINLMDLPR